MKNDSPYPPVTYVGALVLIKRAVKFVKECNRFYYFVGGELVNGRRQKSMMRVDE